MDLDSIVGRLVVNLQRLLRSKPWPLIPIAATPRQERGPRPGLSTNLSCAMDILPALAV